MTPFEKGIEEVRERKYYGISKSVAEAFITSVTKHVEYVHKAANMVGVPYEQIINHDLSKLSEVEFIGYAIQFHSNKHMPELFTKAWLASHPLQSTSLATLDVS